MSGKAGNSPKPRILTTSLRGGGHGRGSSTKHCGKKRGEDPDEQRERKGGGGGEIILLRPMARKPCRRSELHPLPSLFLLLFPKGIAGLSYLLLALLPGNLVEGREKVGRSAAAGSLLPPPVARRPVAPRSVGRSGVRIGWRERKKETMGESGLYFLPLCYFSPSSFPFFPLPFCVDVSGNCLSDGRSSGSWCVSYFWTSWIHYQEPPSPSFPPRERLKIGGIFMIVGESF